MKILYRKIEHHDNAELSKLIKSTLEEYGANKPGTVYFDNSTDHLYELFEEPNSYYEVALIDGKIVGGCGIFPTHGLPHGYIELVKLYVHRDYRKLGIGKALMNHSIDKAKEFNFTNLYLESMPELKQAVNLYQDLGFTALNQSLGDSGHHSCDIWMVKTL